MLPKRTLPRALATTALLALVGHAAAQDRYIAVVIDLPPGGTGELTQAFGLNDAGQVVGHAGGPSFSQLYGIIFARDGGSRIARGQVDCHQSSLFDINGDGLAAGISTYNCVGDFNAYTLRFDAPDMITVLGRLPGSPNATGFGVGQDGRVAGYNNRLRGCSPPLCTLSSAWPTIWDASGPVELNRGVYQIGYAVDISSSGQIAGTMFEAVDPLGSVPVVWPNERAELFPLPTGSTGNGVVRGVNEAGSVVGLVFDTDGNPKAAYWPNVLVLEELEGLPGDTRSEARGVNEAGRVVGFSQADAAADPTAVLFSTDGGPATDLNALLKNPGGIELQVAEGINNNGWIIANGTFNDRVRGFLLIPDSCRADLDGDGSLTIFDFLRFQNLFAAGDLLADFDGDGMLTFFDFLAFQNEFSAGCP